MKVWAISSRGWALRACPKIPSGVVHRLRSIFISALNKISSGPRVQLLSSSQRICL